MINRTFVFCAIFGPLLGHISICVAQTSKDLRGYYPAYNSQFQSPAQIPWALYNELTFFVAIPHLNSTFTYPPGLTSAKFDVLAHQFVKEAKSHNVTPCLSFGGWTGSTDFSKMVTTATSRTKYAKFLINYAKKYDFKCMDLDWEYPKSAGIGCNSFDKSDTVKFGLFVQELRKQWPGAKYSSAMNIKGLIGASGGAATQEETKLLVKNLDYIKIMAYDAFGTWSSTTGPVAPLHATCAPENPISVETAITALTKQGFKLSQIILGVTGYARSYKLTSPKLVPRTVGQKVSYYYQNHTKVAPPGGKTDDQPITDVCGVKTGWGGLWLVKELIEKGYLSKDLSTGGKGYKRTWDECSGQSFLTNGIYFFSYDDKDSIVAKAKYVKKQKLHGLFTFDTQGQPDAVLTAARNAL
ncbi:hypothetical protein CROQUDRAFT_663941 [Cronartium quercuum f. sp. fusiforme G11]|uniref:GH18 domain-containing protein n=1 Tax=Cronartium quercuum f. sp. fusiforme G11 TaxID=708437 RepID=A0A9P6NBW6_9BASI|nr:hypothetical protein CROQUDRAFT_663941 [Cronartium quercuum f. sp. fusiforme G11]